MNAIAWIYIHEDAFFDEDITRIVCEFAVVLLRVGEWKCLTFSASHDERYNVKLSTDSRKITNGIIE